MTIDSTKPKRMASLDALKAVAALLVIFIHFGGAYHDDILQWLRKSINILARIAVPIFFFITGYYYPMIVKKKGLGHYMLRIAVILAVWSLIAFLICCLGGEGASALRYMGSSEFYYYLLCFNGIGIDHAGHLWFLSALLYGLLIFIALDYFNAWKKALPVIAAVFVIGLILNFFIDSGKAEVIWIRSFLVLGVPSMALGRLMSEYNFFNLHNRLSYRQIWAIIAVSYALCLLEYFMFYRILRDIYIFTIPLALGVLLLAFKRPEAGEGSWLAYVGRKCSTHIYVMHLPLFGLIAVLLGKIGLQDYWIKASLVPIFFPVAMFLLCCWFSIAYMAAKRRVSR